MSEFALRSEFAEPAPLGQCNMEAESWPMASGPLRPVAIAQVAGPGLRALERFPYEADSVAKRTVVPVLLSCSFRTLSLDAVRFVDGASPTCRSSRWIDSDCPRCTARLLSRARC